MAEQDSRVPDTRPPQPRGKVRRLSVSLLRALIKTDLALLALAALGMTAFMFLSSPSLDRGTVKRIEDVPHVGVHLSKLGLSAQGPVIYEQQEHYRGGYTTLVTASVPLEAFRTFMEGCCDSPWAAEQEFDPQEATARLERLTQWASQPSQFRFQLAQGDSWAAGKGPGLDSVAMAYRRNDSKCTVVVFSAGEQ